MTPTSSPRSRQPAASRFAWHRKHLFVDQRKLDLAKQVFGVATETEAIDRALDLAEDLAAFQQDVDRGMNALLGRGGFVDYSGGERGDAT